MTILAAVGPSGSKPYSAAQSVKQSQLSSHMRFIEALLGAAARPDIYTYIHTSSSSKKEYPLKSVITNMMVLG